MELVREETCCYCPIVALVSRAIRGLLQRVDVVTAADATGASPTHKEKLRATDLKISRLLVILGGSSPADRDRKTVKTGEGLGAAEAKVVSQRLARDFSSTFDTLCR